MPEIEKKTLPIVTPPKITFRSLANASVQLRINEMRERFPATAITSHIIEDQSVQPELKNGKLWLSVYLAPPVLLESEKASEDELAIESVVNAWASGDSDAALTIGFTVASPIDNLIYGYELTNHPGFIDMDAKPTFDALRAEMVAQIARIDALVFKQVD